MRRLAGSWPYVALLGAALSSWLLAGPDGAPEPTPGLVPPADPGPEERLDRRIAATNHRSAVLRRLAREVAEGRLALLQAAVRFREINESTPDFNGDEFRRAYAGVSDEERYARHVIALAGGQVRGDFRRARAIVGRLEAELDQALRRGPLRLAE